MKLVTADDVCLGLKAALVADLANVVESKGWDDLKPVTDWDQVPDLAAISKAKLPAGAITSPGLVRPPVRTEDGWNATWRVVAGVYDRGLNHDDTASRIRRWAAAVRGVGLANQSLGGVAASVAWVSEVYAQRPEKTAARTIGGCAVAFDVQVLEATVLPITLPGAPPVPTVTHTESVITVR